MNNYWIKCSGDRAPINPQDSKSYNHEKWLDLMNLHETSWLLFARRSWYGWPNAD